MVSKACVVSLWFAVPNIIISRVMIWETWKLINWPEMTDQVQLFEE